MTVYSKDDTCEWDDQKNLLNIKKHHISFETASKVFLDPYFLEIEDEEHSDGEERFQGFGNIGNIVIVTVFYTERCSDGKERHRLISARGLDHEERKAYEEFIKSYTGAN
ncbi:MAG: BrnT family toxin [Spirochaetales bacterium]|nr:BrnT family toxin [Spirochaetales bacterium]